jgi:hypothetical protein
MHGLIQSTGNHTDSLEGCYEHRIYDENSRMTFEDIMMSMIEQEFDKFFAHSYDKNEVDPRASHGGKVDAA